MPWLLNRHIAIMKSLHSDVYLALPYNLDERFQICKLLTNLDGPNDS